MMSSEFDINLIDANYYKFPLFPVSENEDGTLTLFEKLLQIISRVNWSMIYNNSKVNSELYIDDQWSKELLEFTNSRLGTLKSIDKEVELIVLAEKDPSPKRALELRSWLINYFENENKVNFPKFNSVWTLRMAYMIVISILNKIYPEGIWCKSGEVVKVLKQREQVKLFLPSHKSHIDYIIMHIMCIRFSMPTPTVIAGENLNVRFFGNVLAKVGAVFIKRNWFNYTDILIENYSNFFEFVLERKVDMELFIEGGRSRDGKLVVPKFGILKLIFDQSKKTNTPVIIHPLSIQYEKVYEFDSINNELIGKPKHKESMINILKHGFNNMVQSKNYGKVYLQFGETIDILQYQGSVAELGLNVMSKIDEVSYITDISIFNTAIYLCYYGRHQKKALADRLLVHEIISEVDELCKVISSKKSQLNVNRLLKMDKLEKTKRLIELCLKFNKNCYVEKQYFIVKNDTDLIMYKNNLIHLFIRKCLLLRLLLINRGRTEEELRADVDLLISLFEGQFVAFHDFNVELELKELGISKVTQSEIDNNIYILQWYSKRKFLDPFIESYILFGRLLLVNKDAIVKNIRELQPVFTELKNKLYLMIFLKKLNELGIYSKKELINVDRLQSTIEFLRKMYSDSDMKMKL